MRALCGEDTPCYFMGALLHRAWMQNGGAEAPLLGVRALMNHAVQLPERAALDVWAPHKHFEVACWDTSAATGEQFIPLEPDSAHETEKFPPQRRGIKIMIFGYRTNFGYGFYRKRRGNQTTGF